MLFFSQVFFINVLSKSLLSVRGMKGRVSSIKKFFAANWFYLRPEFQKLPLNSIEVPPPPPHKKRPRRILVLF